MKALTREWVKKAENDFKVAGQILRRRTDRIPDAACFFCQQSAEKYLKARLVEAGIGFPKTHELIRLIQLAVQVEPTWIGFTAAAKTITDYAVDFRYPGRWATLREARAAMRHCKTLRKTVRQSLGLRV